jgi:hypothetical protein
MFLMTMSLQLCWLFRRFANIKFFFNIRTTVEICTAMIAACIPCLKPLFKSLLAGSSVKYAANTKNGYIRNNDTSRTFHGRSTNDGFEMYNRSNTTSNVHGGYHGKMDSEESILTPVDMKRDGITKTFQISVSVDDPREKNPKDMV